MSKIFFIVTLFFLINLSYGQQSQRKKLDSLLSKIPELKENNSASEVYFRLGSEYSKFNLDSTLYYYKKCQSLSRKLGEKLFEVRVSASIAATYFRRGEKETSIKLYEELYEKADSLGYHEDAFGAIHSLAVIMNNANRFSELKEYLNLGYKAVQNLGSQERAATAMLYNVNADMLVKQLKLDSAIMIWEAAFDQFEKVGFKGRCAIVKNNLGTTYLRQYNYPKALAMYKDASELAQSWLVKVDAEIGIAKVYAAIDNTQLALSKLLSMHEKEKRVGNVNRVIKIQIELALLYENNGDLTNALKMIGSTFNLLKNSEVEDLKTVLLYSRLHLKNGRLDSANHYFELSSQWIEDKEVALLNTERFINMSNGANISIARQDFDNASRYIAELDSLSKVIYQPKMLVELQEIKYKYYKETGDISRALVHLEKVKNSSENLKALEKRGELIKLSSEIETAAKQKEIEVRNNEIEELKSEIDREKRNELTKTSIIVATVVLALGIIVTRARKRRMTDAALSEQLKNDLAIKNKQLISASMEKVKQGQMLETILDETEKIEKKKKTDLTKITRIAKEGLTTKKSLEIFMLEFETSNPNFFSALREKHANLTSREQHISALLTLNFSTKEIAPLLGIESSSATTARYRLRQKLGLQREQSLTNYLQEILDSVSV